VPFPNIFLLNIHHTSTRIYIDFFRFHFSSLGWPQNHPVGQLSFMSCFKTVFSQRANIFQDFSFGGLGDKTHSTEFSCGKSDGKCCDHSESWWKAEDFNFVVCLVSVDSITEGDRRALGCAEIPASSTYSGALSFHYPQQGLHIRRSLPNMAHSILVHEPAKIYPYHLLLITNYRLPGDVDRCNLEVSSDLSYNSFVVAIMP
jgi:hypothetical protein